MFHRSRALIALALAGALTAGGFAAATAARGHSSTNSSSKAGYLGVNLQDLEGNLRDSYDYDGAGVVVAGVIPDSPADKIGVERGDIITRFNDLAVNNADQLTDRVRALAPGTLATVSVWRDGKTIDLGRVELGSASDRSEEWSPAPRAPRPPRPPHAYDAPEAPEAPHGYQATPRAMAFMMGGRGRLGVETQDLDSDLGEYFSTPDGKGVLVLKVVEDTPAEKAGLKAGDVILAVDGDAVSDGNELRGALRQKEAGPVDLKVRRKGTVRTIKATLEEPQRMHGMMGGGNGNWMGWNDDGQGLESLRGLEGLRGLESLRGLEGLKGLDDGDRHVYRFNSDGDGQGEIRIDGKDDEDQAQLRKDLDEMRKELDQMRREMKNSR